MPNFVSPYSCANNPVRYQSVCPEDNDATNRIIHIAFVDKGTVLAGSTPLALATSLLALEVTGNAKIVRSISGTSDGGAFADLPGRGEEITRTGRATVTLTILDPAIIGNTKFWNDMVGAAQFYDLYYFTQGFAFKVDSRINVKPSAPITDDITTFQEASVVISFVLKRLPEPFEFDTTQLALPQELFNTNTVDFTAGTGTTVDNDEITFTEDVAGAATLTSAVSVSKVENVGGALPTGLALTRTAMGATISGTPTVPGTYEIALNFSNDNGLTARKNITIYVEAA